MHGDHPNEGRGTMPRSNLNPFQSTLKHAREGSTGCKGQVPKIDSRCLHVEDTIPTLAVSTVQVPSSGRSLSPPWPSLSWSRAFHSVDHAFPRVSRPPTLRQLLPSLRFSAR